MFVPAANVGALIAEFRAFQAEVLPLHDARGAALFTGVRYVAADDIALSPQRARDNAVVSFVVTGDAEQTGNFTEFHRYAHRLEQMAVANFSGRPHWGKMHWSDAPTLRAAYGDDAWAAFAEQREAMDPTGVFLNDYLRAHLGL